MVWVKFPVPKVQGRGKNKHRMVTRSKDVQPHQLEVPTDIWVIIAGFLPKGDWKSLRLICRDLRSDMAHMPLFTSLWFSPQKEDIEVFQQVCNDEFFAKHVTTIHYDTVRFPDLNMEDISARWPIYSEEDHERALKFHQRIQYQKHILANEVTTLITGMSKLPQLSKIHFKDSFSGRVSCSPFTRTYWRADTRPWLMACRDWQLPTVTLSQVTTIVRAMANIGPSINELDFSRDRNTVPRDLFPSEGPVFETAKTVFRSLKSLGIAFHDNGMAGQEPLGEGFLKLFHSANNLERIYLDGSKMSLPTLPSLVDELAILFLPGDPDNDLSVPFTFPHLQALDLLSWSAKTEAFKSILENHANSLKWLHLDMVTLAGQPVPHWRSALTCIAEKMDLDAVNIVFEMQDDPRRRRVLAGGPPLPNPSFTHDPWWTVNSQVIDQEWLNL
jgi:hypothetical protein